jgi:2-polyprenyl-3-methyl-5-hydroxy-6-metoxy-1,4-benzoquinol methylase
MQDLQEYSKRTHFYVDEIPPLLSAILDKTEWQRCVDLGCGDGALIAALHNRGYLEGKLLYAVDASESRIDSVREISPEIQCIVGDACDTQIDDGSLDLVISTQVIEHVSDDRDMVREMCRILKDEGTLYLTTIIKKRYGWYFYRCNGKWTLDPTHVREYTQDHELLDILYDYGFEVSVNQKTLESRPLLDAILRRVHAPRDVYKSSLLKPLRKVKLPIPGYYTWELVCRKK